MKLKIIWSPCCQETFAASGTGGGGQDKVGGSKTTLARIGQLLIWRAVIMIKMIMIMKRTSSQIIPQPSSTCSQSASNVSSTMFFLSTLKYLFKSRSRRSMSTFWWHLYIITFAAFVVLWHIGRLIIFCDFSSDMNVNVNSFFPHHLSIPLECLFQCRSTWRLYNMLTHSNNKLEKENIGQEYFFPHKSV